MPNQLPLKWKLIVQLKRAIDVVIGPPAVGLLKLLRRADPDRSADRAGRLLQRVGPLLPAHRVGRANLAAAFPEKSPSEIDQILLGVWDNLGRVAAEFAHLDRLWDYDPTGRRPARVTDSDQDRARFYRLRDSGQSALIFTAHLGNWELPAVAAAGHGLNMAVVYRAPNVGGIAEAVRTLRTREMGPLIPTGPDAPIRAAAALERGTPVAMLVDQHSFRGVDVEFFGRRCIANPMIARLARHFECPIHGARTIRQPDHRFRIEFTEPIVPPRASDGRIDVQGTMQMITSIIEGWVREYPEQWLWLHRRWR
jgi:Kdo2-lipid IVA lauroyltransferase/acyltransferase